MKTCRRYGWILAGMAIFVALNSIAVLAQEAVPQVAMVVHKTEGFHNMFWDALQMGARKAGKDLNVEIRYYGVPVDFGDQRVEGRPLSSRRPSPMACAALC